MITPPVLTPCFYTVLFEKQVSQELMKIMAPLKGGDVDQVLMTSGDFTSDIEATVELEAGVNKIMESAAIVFDRQLTFNPLYLPMSKDQLGDGLEVDKQGEIQSVAGFANPYIASHLQLSANECPDIVDAKVCYKQFPLPSFNEIFETIVRPS
jgi:hypothetical protein